MLAGSSSPMPLSRQLPRCPHLLPNKPSVVEVRLGPSILGHIHSISAGDLLHPLPSANREESRKQHLLRVYPNHVGVIMLAINKGETIQRSFKTGNSFGKVQVLMGYSILWKA